MQAGKARLAAAFLTFLGCALASWAEGPLGDLPQRAPYVPKAERLEILKSWERRPGAGPPPEIVAGIYERDYRRGLFDNKLAITIDDALPNKYLAAALDILKRRGIQAVFFIIGRNFVDAGGRPMPRAKELLDRIVNEGHAIGSHSFWHRRMDEGAYRDNRAAIVEELDHNEAVVDRVLGYHYPIRYFRPPNGAHSTPGYVLDRVLLERGQYLADWTITSFDWNMRYRKNNPEYLGPEKVLARTIKQAREESGGVVLLHGFPSTVAILDRLLGALASVRNERGALAFSTLDEIMRLKYESGR
jgi:peptidoglycan/xylan/chitin deacetylase (PgdA/CDA1 family)